MTKLNTITNNCCKTPGETVSDIGNEKKKRKFDVKFLSTKKKTVRRFFVSRIGGMARKASVVVILGTIDSDSEENLRRPRGPDRMWIRERTGKGAFVNIFKDLELTDAEDFRRFMRTDVPHFQELLSLISSDLQKTETRMRKPIPPKERLALTLRFLATGETFRSLEFQFRIQYLERPFPTLLTRLSTRYIGK